MPHPDKELRGLDARARKNFSQNFLQSPHWAKRLTDAALEGTVRGPVWEVGPGLGALTQHLVGRADFSLTVFELDRKLSQGLREKYDGIQLVEGDFLKCDLPTRLKDLAHVRLVSNLPYHISSPMLFLLMDFRAHFDRIVLTFQREFSARLRATHGNKEYGALSVITQWGFEIHSLGIIPPGAFYPKPSIDSEAVMLMPKAGGSSEELASLSKVTKTAFRHRRKKATSNLNVDFDKDLVGKAFEILNLSSMIRPEEISGVQYGELARHLRC
jgi:16S rRNA (adenine1518-N6/adenine1519-N6)-dimethyltransferase